MIPPLRAVVLTLLFLSLLTTGAPAVSPELLNARAATNADSALVLYHIILTRDGSTGEGAEALARMLDYFCFTRQSDSLTYYRGLYRAGEFSCPGLDQEGDCWRVQLGAFAERDNAFRLANSLREQLVEVEVLSQERRYLVVSRCFPHKKEARTAARQWRKENIIDDYLLRKFIP